MQTSKRAWPVVSVYGIRGAIDTNPDFQRPAVWTSTQKQLLMDTILHGYEVPKFYWRLVTEKPDFYQVIDGQQRLRAIWEFFDGKFGLHKDSAPIGGAAIAGLTYHELPHDLRIRCDSYNLDVVIMEHADETETRQMFLRLQNGKALKPQEKRNAMPGNMRSFIKGLAAHPWFGACDFANGRFLFDHLAAQMVLLELNGGPCSLRNDDLNRMYGQQSVFDENGWKAKKCRRVLDFLYAAFPRKTPELERYNVISLYALASHLLDNYVVKDRPAELGQWFLRFESYRREQDQLPPNDAAADPEMLKYQQRINHASDGMDSIRSRRDFLLRSFFRCVPNVELRDDRRQFTSEQRLTIFRRDRGRCQLRLRCDGAECDWEHWAADHVVPWSQGGRTTVANGQVSCIACNSAKRDRLMSAR